MCNLYQLEKSVDAVRRLFADMQIPLDFPEGIPNFQPRDIRITDRAPIIRWASARDTAEMVERRWSWPAPNGKPVFNMRSDGREFGKDRCWSSPTLSMSSLPPPTQSRSARIAGASLRRAISPLPDWFAPTLRLGGVHLADGPARARHHALP
jgi:hypothetical protein